MIYSCIGGGVLLIILILVILCLTGVICGPGQQCTGIKISKQDKKGGPGLKKMESLREKRDRENTEKQAEKRKDTDIEKNEGSEVE